MRRRALVALLSATLLLPGNVLGDCYGTAVVQTVAPVVVQQVPVPYAYFAFVSPPTTPQPVLLPAQPAAPAAPARRAPAPADAPAAPQPPAIRRAGPPIIRRPGVPAPAPAPGPSAVDVARVASLLQTRCAACHSGRGRGGVALFSEQGVFQPNATPAEIYASVRNDTMPLRQTPLSREEKELLRQWAGQAATR